MVAAPNHTGKLPFIDVQDAAVHTESAPASHNIGSKIAGIGTKHSGSIFLAESPCTKGFPQSKRAAQGAGKNIAED
ncbi:hypothetical protein [Stenotrophomonas humi]|uniref:hypothetical protein n=1 Tax=Stenotrophomonas humi TaxID=405444 RepID=UPI00128EAD3A|nr:hypothetical protein [Stenotrophomonas humi]